MNTEDYLKNWEEGEGDLGDVLIKHFKQHGKRDPLEICDEARRLHKIMFDEIMEEGSAADCLYYAVAVQAFYGAIAAVADCLGVNQAALKEVIHEWHFLCSDSDRNTPDHPLPISSREFFKRIKKETERLGLE